MSEAPCKNHHHNHDQEHEQHRQQKHDLEHWVVGEEQWYTALLCLERSRYPLHGRNVVMEFVGDVVSWMNDELGIRQVTG